MPVYIQNIATAVPKPYFEQSFLRDKMKKYLGTRKATPRIIHRLYSNSGIQKRHAVVNDFHANGHQPFYFQEDGEFRVPSTGVRNECYTHHAKKLFVEVANKLLNEHSGISKKDITHVITVSCTGFFAPEPAFEIVKKLNLPVNTQRYHVGFMGCFAVFPALKMAQAFCNSNPDAVVMIVSVELCSLHLQASENTDQLISNSVFADGAAGAIVSSQSKLRNKNKPVFRLEKFHTSIAQDTEEDMAWTIGDTGFDMVLSTTIAEIIQSNLSDSVAPLLQAYGINADEISQWAVHPGGRAILDKIEEGLYLDSNQIESSRNVLANYGNMSSATILFVLNEILKKSTRDEKERTLAMAFGPGLTIESALLTKLE